MVRVGIPRALLYYQYHPAWKVFFEELGAEVVVSPPTTQSMLAAGTSRVVSDTCLPAKIFIGHVISLKGQCDYIFIPAIRSLKSKTYNCAKFLGLPDMTKAVVPESPPILDIEIDINKGERALSRTIYQLGRNFTVSPRRIKRAAQTAWQAYIDYKKMMHENKLIPPEAISALSGNSDTAFEQRIEPSGNTTMTIGLIGHAYLLYDEHINYRLINRLGQYGIRILTPEMLTGQQLEDAINSSVGSSYWTYEEEVVGAGEHFLQSKIDGIIGVMAFGCGPDSLMMDMVHRRANRSKNTPFMCLTLEEHTSETGIVTRLEAFLDMISIRKRRRAEVCV